MDNLLTIQEISKRSGVAASALRFYEERDLIKSQRSGAGHRRFPRAVLRRIAFIVFAQRAGLSLDQIGAALAKLPRAARPPAGTGRGSRANGARASTSASRSSSASRPGSPNASAAAAVARALPVCQSADRAGRAGPGPRYWIGDRSPKS